jgi:hypothetical protein
MSKHISRQDLQTLAVPAPPARGLPNRAERAFGLPPRLFVATIAAYFAFLAIMAATFMTAELSIPFAIFTIYLVMAFGVPGLWARVAGRPVGRVQTWPEFREEGMMIETGRISGDGAIAQVLTFPILVVGWAIAVAIIVATL